MLRAVERKFGDAVWMLRHPKWIPFRLMVPLEDERRGLDETSDSLTKWLPQILEMATNKRDALGVSDLHLGLLSAVTKVVLFGKMGMNGVEMLKTDRLVNDGRPYLVTMDTWQTNAEDGEVISGALSTVTMFGGEEAAGLCMMDVWRIYQTNQVRQEMSMIISPWFLRSLADVDRMLGRGWGIKKVNDLGAGIWRRWCEESLTRYGFLGKLPSERYVWMAFADD